MTITGVRGEIDIQYIPIITINIAYKTLYFWTKVSVNNKIVSVIVEFVPKTDL